MQFENVTSALHDHIFLYWTKGLQKWWLVTLRLSNSLQFQIGHYSTVAMSTTRTGSSFNWVPTSAWTWLVWQQTYSGCSRFLGCETDFSKFIIKFSATNSSCVDCFHLVYFNVWNVIVVQRSHLFIFYVTSYIWQILHF